MIIALTYYALQIRNQNRTRQAQHYMQMLQTVATEEFTQRPKDVHSVKVENLQDYYDFTRGDSELRQKYDAYMAWVNGLGHMLRRGLIDVETINNFWQGIQFIRAWEKWGPFILEVRKRSGLPQFMSGLEYLAAKMKKSRMERGFPSAWSEEKSGFVQE